MSKFRIGNYRLGKLLGYGSFGVVRLGVNEITNHEVAVKILNKKKLKQMKVKEKVQREIHLWKMFHHPHVVKLYEYFDTKEDFYVVFEYVPKGELFELISNKGQLGEDEARRYFHQLIYALDYTHGFGVAHRDLKPENILLDPHNNIKIADFGLSNIMKEGRALKTSCGSPNYAAPEVICGKPYDGSQIDVWSCGVVLYAMLYGELPFDEENFNTMSKYIRDAKYYMKGAATVEAKDLLNRILQPIPFRRITIEEIKDHPWFKQNIPRYLIERSFTTKASGGHKSLDKEIVDKLFELKLDINPVNRKEIEEAILQGQLYDFWVAYEYFLHSKMMKEIMEDDQQQPRKIQFNRSLLGRKAISLINLANKNLESFGQEEITAEQEENKDNKNLDVVLQTNNSFHTNSTSTANFKEILSLEKDQSSVGILIKARLQDLMQAVFKVLKDMGIIWKRWNSDYVYKWQTGIPVQEAYRLSKIKDKFEEFYEKDMLKFFLHFSSNPRKQDIIDFVQGSKYEAEYLVSFIWIKGNTLKYLDFVSMFKINIENRL